MAAHPRPPVDLVPERHAVSLEKAELHGNELINIPVGDIEWVHSYFNDNASRRLYDQLDYQRAAQSYIWSTPLVSVTTWRDRQGKAFGVKRANDFVVLRSLKQRRGIVTANLTTPYILNFTTNEESRNLPSLFDDLPPRFAPIGPWSG